MAESASSREDALVPGRSLGMMVIPDGPDVSLPRWAAARRDVLRARLLDTGAILFRGFGDSSAETLEQTVRALADEPLAYSERSSPRHVVVGNVYTSTDFPPERSIYLHNEQSYNLTWPMRIFFHCAVAPAEGGATPIADCRVVYSRLSEATRERFRAGYTYVRNFAPGLGLTWREAFQTEDRSAVDAYCRANAIETEWHSGTNLTTRQIRPAMVTHPETGEELWFNHLTFFHVSTLGPRLAERLIQLVGVDRLPNNTYYADGSPIEPEILDELRAAYDAETVAFRWQEGDVLMLDNMLVAHGRQPFVPPRRVVVGMAEPFSASRGA